LIEQENNFGEAPKSAREARALPKKDPSLRYILDLVARNSVA
jgi:hypothetical protein